MTGINCSRQLIPSVGLLEGKDECLTCLDTYLTECIRLYGSLEEEFKGRLTLFFEGQSGNYNVLDWKCLYSDNYGDNLMLFLRDIELRLLAIQMSTLLCRVDCNSVKCCESKPVKSLKNEEQVEKRVLEMLLVLASIYEFCFNRAAMNYGLADETWSIEGIFNFIFCVNPSAMKYVTRILKFYTHPSKNEELKSKFKEFKARMRHSKRNWLVCAKVFKAPLSLSELSEFDHKDSILKNATNFGLNTTHYIRIYM